MVLDNDSLVLDVLVHDCDGVIIVPLLVRMGLLATPAEKASAPRWQVVRMRDDAAAVASDMDLERVS